MLSLKQERALQALLTYPVKKDAAQAAGISDRTLRKYLENPEFIERYVSACRLLLDGATRELQKALNPAVQALRSIVEDEDQNPSTRVSAARAILEYTLRLTEINDILAMLDEV